MSVVSLFVDPVGLEAATKILPADAVHDPAVAYTIPKAAGG